jgi:hypothetical protein
MRDDFSQKIKEKLASRVAHKCSNPDCRASTSGPQLHPDKSVNVGVAAHICAAAPGGPRYEPTMSASERAAIKNGIWLCQVCAKLVDADEMRYSLDVLLRWKTTAEREAQRQIGKGKPTRTSPLATAERRIKIDLKMRDTMQGDLLKGAKEYALERRDPNNTVRRPYEKFRRSEVVIHRLGDDCYPKIDDGPGISSWFKLELFDFYERGLVVILGIERAVIADGQYWATIERGTDFDTSVFTEINVWRLGRIPFCNIRHYDPKGDQDYPLPHLYCVFDHNGMPYEEFGYAVVGSANEYDWPLQLGRRLDLNLETIRRNVP